MEAALLRVRGARQCRGHRNPLSTSAGPGPLFPGATSPTGASDWRDGAADGCVLEWAYSPVRFQRCSTIAVYGAEDLFQHPPIHWMWWPAIGGVAIGIGGLILPGDSASATTPSLRCWLGDVAGKPNNGRPRGEGLDPGVRARPEHRAVCSLRRCSRWARTRMRSKRSSFQLKPMAPASGSSFPRRHPRRHDAFAVHRYRLRGGTDA